MIGHWIHGGKYNRVAHIVRLADNWYRVDCYDPGVPSGKIGIIEHEFNHATHCASYRTARIIGTEWRDTGKSPLLNQPRSPGLK